MGRGVRPTRGDDIRQLSDSQLEGYIFETKRRIGAMTNAGLRNNYRKQLLIAEKIQAERQG